MFEGLAAAIATKVAEKLVPILAEQFAKWAPVIVGALIKALGDQLKARIPDLKVPNVEQLPEVAKGAIDHVIAADPDLPGLSNIFDLTEWLKGLTAPK